MSTVDKFAEKLAKSVVKDNQAFDPATFMAFAELIMALIDKIRECKAAKDVPATAKSPTLFQRVVLKNTVRNQLGRQAFRQHGDDVIDGLLKIGGEATEKEIQELYNEV